MKTELLHRAKADIQKAGDLLRQGQVVGIPTETVYGLAANALDAEAVLRIFEAKGRPQDNPLIIHMSRLEQLEELAAEVSPAVYQMAEHFWPGPLTMVVKKKDIVPDRTSAGLDTVGIRMPSHPVARAIIDAAGLQVTPGFIDSHSHSDRSVFREGGSGSYNSLLQGVTTQVAGQCGSSVAPWYPENARKYGVEPEQEPLCTAHER